MTQSHQISRRTALKVGAGAAALPLVHIRTAGAAGKLSGAVVRVFVPGYVEAMQKLVDQWAAKTMTEVRLDFISAGAIALSEAAEAQARVGHDFRGFIANQWDMHVYASQLEPMDDVVDRLCAKYGTLPPLIEHLGKAAGSWRGVPGSPNTVYYPSCTRMDLFRQHVGMDVQAVFPVAAEMGPGYDQWTWDAFLIAAKKCFKAGYPFGLPLGMGLDATYWVGALFRSFGAELVDAEGNITVRSDNVGKVLDYARRLTAFLPPDVFTWDDASDLRGTTPQTTRRWSPAGWP
jgi:ABC-type glycerol-3-phosphate transport system substrate-binding protein